MVKWTLVVVGWCAGISLASENANGIHHTDQELYLNNICSPLFNDGRPIAEGFPGSVSTLANSEFPCDQVIYQHWACMANGTDLVDYLAEQQCLCEGSYFEAHNGCKACYKAHGYNGKAPYLVLPNLSADSSKLCSAPTPSEAWNRILYSSGIDYTDQVTFSSDPFFNDTATSHYFTATQPLTLGEITGAASARQQTLTASGAIAHRTYDPATKSPTVSTPVSPATASLSASISGSVKPTQSGSFAVRNDGTGASCLIAVAMGAIALL